MATKFEPQAGLLLEEVRLAVVMYGGISLCVYMNGITDQLWHLVRATARESTPDGDPYVIETGKLVPIERVYRRLSQVRSNSATLGAFDSCPADGQDRSRFVIDVLSGTSAGGLNSLFLAKALACEQKPTSLTRLWISEGDMTTLLNDSGSKGVNVSPENPPQSLLNSSRMAQRLLEALRDMDDDFDVQKGSRPKPGSSKLVERLDLFMTATDLAGLDLSLELDSNERITELRHKNVFHFVHDPNDASVFATPNDTDFGRNDFVAEAVPLLTFVSRATSCIAPAFEPMRLDDIGDLLDPDPDNQYDRSQSPWLFSPFYRDYWNNSRMVADADAWAREPVNKGLSKEAQLLAMQRMNQEKFAFRSFGDGGYGNNYPFNWAIDTISARTAELSVDRKLMYIEPDPNLDAQLDVSNETPETKARPDVFAHVSAMASVKMDQPIRDQIDRVRDRNRMLGHLNQIKDPALNLLQDQAGARQQEPNGPYLHLRVAATTDYLADLIAGALGFELSSPYWEALRYVAKALREIYMTSLTDNRVIAERALVNAFDISYRERHIRFLADEVADRIQDTGNSAGEVKRLRNLRKELADLLVAIFHWRSYLQLYQSTLLESNDPSARATNARPSPDHHRLARLRSHLNAPGGVSAPDFSGLIQAIAALTISTTDLVKIVVQNPSDTDRQDAANALIAAKLDRSHALNKAIEEALTPLIKYLDIQTAAIANRFDPNRENELAVKFQEMDRWLFPPFYVAGDAESRLIDIVRVSPLDCNTLVKNSAMAKKKLAGTGLGHFSGFFHPAWRGEDVLWGRLDGAERLICSILPKGSLERTVLIAQAQLAVLQDTDVDEAVKDAVQQLDFDPLDDAQTMETFRATRIRQVVRSVNDALAKLADTKPEPLPEEIKALFAATDGSSIIEAISAYGGVLTEATN